MSVVKANFIVELGLWTYVGKATLGMKTVSSQRTEAIGYIDEYKWVRDCKYCIYVAVTARGGSDMAGLL